MMKGLTKNIPFRYMWLSIFAFFVMFPSVFAQQTSGTDEGIPLYQLCLWTKNGLKTGYLSTDHPRFTLDGDHLHVTTDKVTFDIAIDEFDRFTLEQVLPDDPKPVFRFYVWLRNGAIHGYDLEECPLVTLGESVFTLSTTLFMSSLPS